MQCRWLIEVIICHWVQCQGAIQVRNLPLDANVEGKAGLEVSLGCNVTDIPRLEFAWQTHLELCLGIRLNAV